MQRATATAGRWVGALGAGLALPFCLMAQAGTVDSRPAAAASASVLSSMTAFAADSTLARWRSYALASITPQFSWALRPQSLIAPKVLDNYSGEVMHASLFDARQTSATHLSISIATDNVGDTPSVLPSQTAHLVNLPQAGIQRTVVAPSLSRGWGDSGNVRLTGVLAYQRFASLGLGTAASDGWAPAPGWYGDQSYGAGARIDVSNALSERLSWNVGYQSRVGMGAFANYHGVFADAGNFDIPASATAQLRYALSPSLSIDIGVQRVMYSSIEPFTSSNLPTRFLALLGDGSSPDFAWRDLDVYSVGWTLHNAKIGDIELRYTTRQQPVPTSRLLENALSGAIANDMVSLGWSRAFSAHSSLNFMASYASSPYYLLMPSYLAPNDGKAGRFEFEALWSTRF